MRLFFAAWPPPETARALEAWASPLEGRITPAHKIHLTLAFLGDVAPERAILAARRVQAETHLIPIEIAQYWKHNRVLWAGPPETPKPLKALVDKLHFELDRAQFTLERRPFAAHVTLLRAARAPESLPPLPRIEWPVREFVLARSVLSGRGSTYEIAERFPLQDPG